MDEWRTTFKRNWLYMLTGTLVSVFLWIAVSADTVEQRTLPVDLLVGNNDRRYVLTEQDPTDEVSVAFTGRAGDLALLSLSRPQILVSIDSVESADSTLALIPSMVQTRGGQELVDVRAISVRPNRLSLHFEPRQRKQVRVVPRVEVSLARGFAIADSPRAEPGAVTVDGPQVEVTAIDSLVTLTVARENLREPLDVVAPVEIDPQSHVEVTPASVRVKMSVEPWAERVFRGVPMSLLDAADGYRIEPPLVDVRLSGPSSLVNAVRAGDLVPRVELGEAAADSGALPILLTPPSPFVTVSIEPDSAWLVPSEPTEM